jgi:hypothetical protein
MTASPNSRKLIRSIARFSLTLRQNEFGHFGPVIKFGFNAGQRMLRAVRTDPARKNRHRHHARSRPARRWRRQRVIARCAGALAAGEDRGVIMQLREAIQGNAKDWIASSQELLAMTWRGRRAIVATGASEPSPSLRAPQNNPATIACEASACRIFSLSPYPSQTEQALP